MPPAAPLTVPVELRVQSGARGAPLRWFRLASAVAEDGLLFPRPLPDELAERGQPFEVRFHLPEDDLPLAFEARAVEVDDEAERPRGGDDRPRARAARFIRPDEEGRARIARYVESRLDTP